MVCRTVLKRGLKADVCLARSCSITEQRSSVWMSSTWTHMGVRPSSLIRRSSLFATEVVHPLSGQLPADWSRFRSVVRDVHGFVRSRVDQLSREVVGVFDRSLLRQT
jgi:hypothetical protein